jgi:hypothetical protein
MLRRISAELLLLVVVVERRSAVGETLGARAFVEVLLGHSAIKSIILGPERALDRTIVSHGRLHHLKYSS